MNQGEQRGWVATALRVAGFLLWVSGCSSLTGIEFDRVKEFDAAAPASCVPKTCKELGATCGAQDDGCGRALSCGTCGAGERCVRGKCSCKRSCADLGVECGRVSDGCGGELDCGACTGDKPTCSTAGKCVCIPKTCADLGNSNCGRAPDGCGGTLNCGVCTFNNTDPNCDCLDTNKRTCGGGGANRCGALNCVPLACPQGACGAMSDGCGLIVQCGTVCPPGQTCGGAGLANKCGCARKTCAMLGKNCGQVSDGCGGTEDCGACSFPDTCGGGGTPNVCGCTPQTKCSAEKTCGVSDDGCGGTVICGTCPGGRTCLNHRCESP